MPPERIPYRRERITLSSDNTSLGNQVNERAAQINLAAYQLLQARRNTVRNEPGNKNLTDELVDQIIEIRKHPVQNALIGPARKPRLNQELINQQHKQDVEEARNINNGLRLIGYSDMSDRQAELNPLLVNANLKNFKTDAANAIATIAAIIPGMLWLRGFSAPLYYGANAGLTALSGYDWYKNGPNFWNVSGTVLGGLDLGLPAVSKGVQALNPNNTNIRFIRNVGGVPMVDEAGTFSMAPERNAFANFTWDKSFRTHKRYKTRPGTEYLIVDPKAFKGDRFLSTDPMDTFIPNRRFNASDVTFISGNAERRALAESRGFNVMSSPEIDAAYNRINFSGEPNGSKLRLNIPLRSNEAKLYDDAVNAFIHKTYGKPNVLDALKLWYKTGINPHIKFRLFLQYHPSTPIESKLGKRFGFESHPSATDLPANRVEEILNELGSKSYRGKLVANNISTEYTNKYLELLGNKKEAGKFTGTLQDRSGETRPFADYMESLGIDSSVFTENDIQRLSTLRDMSIDTPATGRGAVVSDKIYPTGTTEFNIDLYNDGDDFGYISAYGNRSNNKKPNGASILSIKREETSPARGFSQDAYNAAIDYIQLTNFGEGLISGKHLLSPEITYKVWEHYPTRKIIGNTGTHEFGKGRDVEKVNAHVERNGPIFMLTEPSKTPIPMKSSNVFHPDMIQNGRLMPPDWTKRSMYYSLPLLLGTYGTFTNKETNSL